MLRCKHVAKALADTYYNDLPWWRRVGLKSHVVLCVFCGKYHRNVMTLQDAVQHYLKHEDKPKEAAQEMSMSDDSKARIQQKLQEAAAE